jgi:hypothetical protein
MDNQFVRNLFDMLMGMGILHINPLFNLLIPCIQHNFCNQTYHIVNFLIEHLTFNRILMSILTDAVPPSIPSGLS